MLLPAAMWARQGAPHSVEISTNFSDVSLSWKAPQSAKTLAWHNGYAYDGDDGRQATPQKPAVIYVASRFTPADLSPLAGEVIDAVDYYEYRPVVAVTVLIYEDGKVVREQPADMSGYKKDSFRTIHLDAPYTIPAGKEVMVALKIEHGPNLTMSAIMDNAVNSKGDLYSFDGKTWSHNGRGTYLVTAHLANDVDEAPDSYNVYANGVKVAQTSASETSCSLSGQASGKNAYAVEAVYSAGAYKSPEYYATVKTAADSYPAPASLAAAAADLDVALSWSAPLLRGSDNLLAWTNGIYGNAIGGTASSNTKVWIKNEFDADDLISFVGGKLTAINGHFKEATVTGLTLWVMKDGVFVYSEVVPAETIAQIKADQWTKFKLTTPVEIESGSSYAYGYYVLQTPKTKPISVDSKAAVGSKGNCFSTSSPSSSNFLNSKPTWKTLASGNIPGNWMLTADIEGGTAYGATTKGYNVYRDDQLIAQSVTATGYNDVAPAPGSYVYSVEAVADNGNVSERTVAKATAKLPAAYRAPLFSSASLDRANGTVALAWGMDVELKHHDGIAYKAGFDEDMELSYGTRFTADEVAPYAGYRITKINFIIGDDLPEGFSLDVYGGRTLLSSTAIGAGEVSPLAAYTLTLDTPVEITGSEDIIIAYNAALPGGSSPIILDGGPLVTGGAIVKLPGMSTWMNLGTINSNYNNYNIAISAVASEVAGTQPQAAPASVEIGSLDCGKASLRKVIVPAAEADYGINPEASASQPHRAPASLTPASFNIYCNGELTGSTDERSFTAALDGYGMHTFAVSAVYPNGWESAKSESVVVDYDIEQAGIAPYDLRSKHDVTDTDATHDLQWSVPESAPVLSYCVDGASYGVGMTGSGTRETYAVQLFPAEKLTASKGMRITHIKFGLYSVDVNSASVVIFVDKNLVYEQEIALSDLRAISTEGYNEIRLNEPFVITADRDIMIGYHLTYANGVKPMLFDAGPADDGYGNLLSASAGDTSWKTLKSLNKTLDGNWRIYATLAAPDRRSAKAAAAEASDAVTYNIYRDGEKIVSGVTATSYDFPENGMTGGAYHVTAENAGIESAASNKVYIGLGGVDDIVTDCAQAYYDAASRSVVLPSAETFGTVYNASGVKVASGSGKISLAGCPAGLYMLSVDGSADALKFVVK